MATHALFESASGYAIFEVKLKESVGAMTKAVQESLDDLAKFGKMVTLISFSPFKSAAHALENANDISEGILNDHLKSLLELNLSKPSKKSSVTLAVWDGVLSASIKSVLGIECDSSDTSKDIIRGIRQHAPKLLKGLQADDLTKAQLGLGHSYSRAKLKFNVNRIDNMIIQAIALLDQLDKDVNLFSMRIREWYGYHFPELVRIVPDNYQYAQVAQFLGAKETLTEEKLPDLAAILDDDMTRAQNVLDAAKGSMGASLSDIDMLNINAFATRVVSIADYRKSLMSYLAEKMNLVAPSLTALLGERIGARLISHAGSLTNLSKYPASTVQILGAEKALFRALKTKGNTPKYGLIYHSSFIGRAGLKHKGRISRFLANKCSIASRIDCYSDKPSPMFGEALRQQVEERLSFFETGQPPSKNADAIRKVLAQLALDDDENEDEEMADEPALPLIEPTPKKDKERKKKRKSSDDDDDMDVDEGMPVKRQKLSKEEKKALKREKKKERKEKSGIEGEELSKKEKKEKKEKHKSKQ
ncbi:snoRNP complex protein nop56 [Taiwanofungus camphoratus]|nr:snoRNP complex protein nop56 [Antrodia cinnamomea]KAI0926989.1 snoRNP complex protein nop56 [Antrodia cinnamomea]KAI0947407.1 snoRNP complex protein nop56 [Antrodia cinnamomea]KAI0953417.1 snoRNP complex protein nop56 [Antrodia cinnamomea]